MEGSSQQEADSKWPADEKTKRIDTDPVISKRQSLVDHRRIMHSQKLWKGTLASMPNSFENLSDKNLLSPKKDKSKGSSVQELRKLHNYQDKPEKNAKSDTELENLKNNKSSKHGSITNISDYSADDTSKDEKNVSNAENIKGAKVSVFVNK